MEEEKEQSKTDKINEFYSTFFKKLRVKIQGELTLTDAVMHRVMLNRGKNHEYYISVMVEEKRKLKDAESKTERMFKKLIKHYMSPAANISAKTITEAKEYALKDERYINAVLELGWRKQLVDYLTEMNKILTKQYFTVTNILDFYKLDPSSMASKMQEETDD